MFTLPETKVKFVDKGKDNVTYVLVMDTKGRWSVKLPTFLNSALGANER